MKSLDSLTWYIMDAMADDWESIVQLRPCDTQFCGDTPDPLIVAVLQDLHQAGLVRLMDENGTGTDEFPADTRDHRFEMTSNGRALWDSEGHKYRGDIA
jgi:hypothetical protein